MSADVTIVAASATGVLVDPVAGAVAAPPARYTVRVVAADGSVSTRPVRSASSRATLAEIKSGLQAGERGRHRHQLDPADQRHEPRRSVAAFPGGGVESAARGIGTG